MRHEEIKIGALYPLTGNSQSIGESIRKALDFYVDIINNKNKLPNSSALELPYLCGRSVKLIWGDTEGNPIVAQAEVKRLIKDEGVTSIIGCYNTAVSAAVSLQTEILEIPFLNPDSDAKMLTKRGLKWFFRTGPDSIIYTEKLFNLLYENGFANTTFGSLSGNTLLGEDEVQALINISEKSKHKITVLELFDDNFPITKKQLMCIKHANPNIFFLPQDNEDAVDAINISKEIQYCPIGLFSQTGFLSTEELLNAAGKDAEYVISTAAWAKGLTEKLPLARKVNHMYKCKYGENLNSDNALSFTGLYVLINAISRAVSNNPRAIRMALKSTSISSDRLILPWKGIRFDETGQNIFADSMVVQILNGTHKIVWPKNLAETNVVLPSNLCR